PAAGRAPCAPAPKFYRFELGISRLWARPRRGGWVGCPAMFAAHAPWVCTPRQRRSARTTRAQIDFGGKDERGAAMTAARAEAPTTTHPVWRRLGKGVLLALLLAAGCAALAVPAARAAMPPAQDPFYKFEGKKLKKIAPGTVLKTRTVPFHLSTIELPI